LRAGRSEKKTSCAPAQFHFPKERAMYLPSPSGKWAKVVVLSVVLSWPIAAAAAPRMVICEAFTSVNCSYARYADEALDRMLNNYGDATPPGTFTVVEYHFWCDPYYTDWGDDRAAFYGVDAVPIDVFDGVQSVVGAYSTDSAYSNYMNKYTLRQGAATDVTIQLGGTEVGENTYAIKVRVGIEVGGTAKSLRIYLAQVLDHYPPGVPHGRYSFVQAATEYGAEDVVTVSPGQYQFVERTFVLAGASLDDPNNIKIVAWAQHEPLASGKEVYQAATMHWPFSPLQVKGDMNGDDNVNIDDIVPFTLALVDLPAWQAEYPDLDVLRAGDMTDDGVFDGQDIAGLVSVVINDSRAPTLDPMTWVSYPDDPSTSSITMTAATTTAPPGVE
jgi:hypothetical protein